MPFAEVWTDEVISVQTEYREREEIKQVPGALWNNDHRVWTVPLTWAACVQLRGIFGDRLQVGAALNEWVGRELQERILPCMELRHSEDAEDLAFLSRLKPFQRAGVKFMATAGSALNGDEMRLGKTVQTIATLEVVGDDAYPALIVCPNGVKQQWADEFAEWAPGRRVTVVRGGAVGRRKLIQQVNEGEADVLVMNYESLRAHTRLDRFGNEALTDKEKEPKELNEIEFGTVVADEAHRILDPHSKQTRAAWWLAGQARRRYALSGTPGDDPEDFWAIMRFLAPREFPAKTKYIERYALQSWNVFGFKQVVGLQPEHSDELFRIVDPRFIRRTRQAVLPQLPPKIPVTRLCEMAKKQKDAYEQMRKDMVAELENGVLVATDPLTKMTRLLQFASAYGELGEPSFDVALDGARVAGPFQSWNDAMVAKATLDPRSVVRDQTPLVLTEPSCKVDELEDAVAALAGVQAAVFAESRQLIELAAKRLLKRGYKCCQVTGAVSEVDRALNVKGFQDGEYQLALVTLGAGGEGLTLSSASAAIFMQRSWSHIKNEQAEDRIVHMEMGDSPLIIDLVTEGTAEARVHAVRKENAAKMEEFCRDQAMLAQWLAK